MMVWLQAHFAKTQQVVKQSVASLGLRTGAYTEFGNTGISDVSGTSTMTSGIGSSGTGTVVNGTSLDVEEPHF